MRAVRSIALFLVGLPLVGSLAGCGPRERRPLEFRQASDHFYFTITSDPIPPHAREATLYKVVVRDKDSRQPIESGEGRMYASNIDRAQTWDSFRKGAEIGTYYAKLDYVTAGTWAVAIEFRRDSTQKLDKIEWMQDVLAAREKGP